MPNYCVNKLVVKGHIVQLNHFLSKVRGENDELILEGIYPVNINIDESMFELDDDQFESQYLKIENEWKQEAWGTTYIDICSFTKVSKSEVVINFYSAWSPPDKWVLSAAKRYARLKFRLTFEEEGVGYYGEVRCQGPNSIQKIRVKHVYPKDLYKWKRIRKLTDLDNES